ncbi:MAG: type I secretion system permease/ATPase [Magnetococcales bacterium]|nr:type I secretion system permease/ATPase [Magnetococcales bacterium]
MENIGTSDTPSIVRSLDPGLACVELLARFHQVPCNREGIKRRYGGEESPFGVVEIQRALKSLGFKARQIRPTWERLDRLALPAIVPLREGGFGLLARVEEHQALVLSPFSQRARSLPRQTFESQWDGSIILAAHRKFSRGRSGFFDISWFIPAVLKYRWLFVEILSASLFIQIFALISPIFFQVVIDKVLVHNGMTTLDVLAIGMLGVSLFEVILGGLRTYLLSHTTNRIDVELGAKLFTHLVSLPLAWFGARRVGDSVARVRELENIRNFLTGSALSLAIDLPFLVVFFIVMALYSPLLTGAVLLSIPCYVLLSLLVIPILRHRLEDKFHKGAENQAFLVESITGVETVKTLAVEPRMIRHWEEQLARYVHSAFRVANLGNIAGQIAQFINKLTTLAILWIGAHAVMAGELSIGQLVAFNMLAGRVSGPILRMTQLWQDYQQTGVSIRRLGDILNAPGESGHDPSHSAPAGLRGEVVLDGVTFRYQPDGPEILKEVSLTIHVGEVIGIAGRSGSGKSTLGKLIQRLYVPERGRILVDDVDLSQVDPAWLRRQVGVVLQENFLFNRSIRENIALVDPSLPMDVVENAARLAGAHGFIAAMPNGYDSLVEEHGSNFSGGQRQRIAIARALAMNPRILIFDEATSALDYESERAVQENMAAMSSGRTVVIIAHRLSALHRCDRIVVMEQGRIAEQGRYGELVAAGGWFASLHQSQAPQALPA